MKHRVLSMAVLSSLLLSGGSLAAGMSADIKVVGELIAPTCEVSIPRNGVFDFGSISHTLIKTDSPASLGRKEGGAMSVKCDAETPLTFRVVDNRAGTASMPGAKYLGLGHVNGTGKLGYYTVQAYLPRVDGKFVSMFVTDGGVIPATSGEIALEHGKRAGWASTGLRELAIGKEFSAQLRVEAFLAKRGDMHGGIGDDVKLDGSTTLEFGFGL